MAKVVVMPRSDIMTTENIFVGWLKEVEVEEPLFQIETEKSIQDIESLYEGVLLEKIAEPEQVFPVGAPMGIIGEPGEEYDFEALTGMKRKN